MTNKAPGHPHVRQLCLPKAHVRAEYQEDHPWDEPFLLTVQEIQQGETLAEACVEITAATLVSIADAVTGPAARQQRELTERRMTEFEAERAAAQEGARQDNEQFQAELQRAEEDGQCN